jgi:transcriptional regulator with XRE-family HTH domain
MSQDELAYEAEISRSYLSQLEKGSFYVSIKVIGKLAETLDVEPDEFLKRPLKRRNRSLSQGRVEGTSPSPKKAQR